jgi:hypothetical protein
MKTMVICKVLDIIAMETGGGKQMMTTLSLIAKKSLVSPVRIKRVSPHMMVERIAEEGEEEIAGEDVVAMVQTLVQRPTLVCLITKPLVTWRMKMKIRRQGDQEVEVVHRHLIPAKVLVRGGM